MALTKEQRSLVKWTGQKWRTRSGKKSSETGEVYAPKNVIERLMKSRAGKKKLAEATRKKREATEKGKQFAKHGLHKGKKYN